jgi:acetyl esterase/lipase
VAVALTSVLFVLALVALIALRPVLRPPFSGLSFTIGFPASELSGQLLVLAVAVTATLLAIGWPRGPLAAVAAGGALCAIALDGSMLARSLRASRVVLQALRATPGFEDLDVATDDRWLRWWRTWAAAPLGHRSVTIHRDLRYVDDGDRAHVLDVYTPAGGTSGAPVLLFVHGGAWVFGSKRGQGLPMLHELTARGWVCVTCDYRLSPRATWPDHIVDVKRALAWTRRHAGEFGGDPTRFLAVAGNSAGGHLASLAALAATEPAWQPGFETDDTHVDACVSLYGVLEVTGDPDLTGPQGRATVALLERTVMKAPILTARELYESASPLHRLGADAPAFMVLHGTHDSLVPVAVPRAFVAAFRKAAPDVPVAYVELPWAQHAFDLLCSPRCTATTRGIAAYLDALVARNDASESLRPARQAMEGGPRS